MGNYVTFTVWRLPVNSSRVEYIIKAWLKEYKIITLHQTRFDKMKDSFAVILF
jgi:hypothetical protein